MRVTFLAAHGMGMSSDAGEVRVAGRSVEIRRNDRVAKKIELEKMGLAPYVYPGSGRLGSVVIVEGEGEAFRIACHGHSFATERYDTEGTPYVDAWCESNEELDDFVRVLDTVLGPPALDTGYRAVDGPPSQAFEIELLPNPHGAAALRTALAAGGAGIGTLALFLGALVVMRGSSAEVDVWVIVGIVAAIVAAAVAHQRTKPARLRLRVDGPSAILLDARGSELARAETARASLRVSTWKLFSRYGSSSGPRVDLRLGAREISFGCLGPYASGPEARAPDRLVGPADFERLKRAWGF